MQGIKCQRFVNWYCIPARYFVVLPSRSTVQQFIVPQGAFYFLTINIGIYLIACPNRIEIYQQIISIEYDYECPCPLCLRRGENVVDPQIATHKQLAVTTSWNIVMAEKEGKKGK